MNTIAIIGCGHMGLIYAGSFLKYELASRERLLLVEKNEARRGQLAGLDLGQVVTIEDRRIADAGILLLAVKPQDFRELAPQLKPLIRKDAVILSIMAGMSIALICEALGHPCIVRAMPNLPVSLGMGMTAFVAAPELSPEQLAQVEHLLSASGKVIGLGQEAQLDAVTALSGSGPAYFFYFVRALIDAGVRMGFDEEAARLLVQQTMLGSYHLLAGGGKSPEALIASVASKGGTTEAALKTFEMGDLHGTIVSALLNAEKRAKELSIK